MDVEDVTGVSTPDGEWSIRQAPQVHGTRGADAGHHVGAQGVRAATARARIACGRLTPG